MKWGLGDDSTRVAFAGDWHGNLGGVWEKLSFLVAAGITRVHHVGDFGIWPDKGGTRFLNDVELYAAELGIRIAVTPGNHEHWAHLVKRFRQSGGGPAAIRPHIAALPRGYRWTHGGRSFVSFGGAASIDFEYRVPRISHWEEELPRLADVAAVSAGGHAEVMVMHDSPRPGTAAVERIRSGNPQGWSESALAYAAEGTARVTAAYEAVQPDVLVHGHFHIRDEFEAPNGQRIVSLAAEQSGGNVIILDLATMSTVWLEDLDA